MISRTFVATLIALLTTAGLHEACRAQALETETARFLPARSYELGTAFEFQTSAEGRERAVPLALEYGIADHLSLLVEPVAYTAILPHSGPSATGVGDLEVTAFYLLGEEVGTRPALSVAAEVKLPTAKNTLIGTGKTDFTGYLIASKHLGLFDVHANAGYTVFGQPPGAHLNGIFNGALAAEWRFNEKLMVFGEALGNTSSASEGEGDNPTKPNAVIPEATGGESSGTVGVGLSPAKNSLISLGVSYDNLHAWLIRPGLAWRFR